MAHRAIIGHTTKVDLDLFRVVQSIKKRGIFVTNGEIEEVLPPMVYQEE